MGRQGKTEANSPKEARAGAYQAEQQLPSGRIYPDLPRSVGGNMGEYQRQWQPTCQGILVKMLGLGMPWLVIHTQDILLQCPCYNQCANTLARCAMYRDKVHRLCHLPTLMSSEGCAFAKESTDSEDSRQKYVCTRCYCPHPQGHTESSKEIGIQL